MPEWAFLVTFRPKQPKWDQNLETTSTHVTFVWEFSRGSRSPSVPLDFSQGEWLPSFESIGSASLTSDFNGWQVSRWEVMVYWHSCTLISWEKPRELTHFISLLLPLMLRGSKLMLNLYSLRVSTSLLTGCDTKVTLDSGLSLGAWKQKLTTLHRKKQSVKGRNLLTEISLTKVFKCGLLISGR